MYKNLSNKPNKPKAIDGFLASGPRKPAFKATPSKTEQSDFMRPRQSTKLDNFNKPDGFRSQETPRLSSSGAYTNPQNIQNTQNNHKNRLNATPLTSNYARSARPAKTKNHRRRRSGFKIFMRISILLIIVTIGITGWMFGKAWWTANKSFKGGGDALALNKELDPNLLKGEGDGRVNILLMGKGGENHDGGELTDSIMIASIDPINYGVTMLSLPRDLWVKPTGLWPMKINAVYSSAKSQALYTNPKDKSAAESKGINALESTVENYMGVKINYYAMIDFTAFQESVDAVGGIDVNLKEPYSDPTMRIGKKVLKLPAGPQHLDGATALGYARSRYGAERGDFDRGEHQQTVLVGIKDKVLSLGTFSNPVKVTELLNTFGNRVQTNFSVSDLMRLYDLAKQINSNNINNVDLAMEGQAVVKTANIGGQSVVVPIAGADNYTKIKEFVRLQLKDGFIIKENPSIIVLNGSGLSGAAQKRADELKSYGYNVIQVADAPNSNIQTTQLIDTTGGAKKYTKRYLELRFNTSAVKSVKDLDLTPYTADYIIIIGPSS